MAIGLPVAAAFPFGIPILGQKRIIPIILSILYALAVAYPEIPSWASTIALVATLATAITIQSLINKKNNTSIRSNQAIDPLVPRLLVAIIPIVILGLTAVALHKGASTLSYINQLLSDNRAIIVASGYLGAAFAGEVIVSHSVGHLLNRAKHATEDDIIKLRSAGAHIGWIERSIFYPLFIGGAADAAAIALTAKSIVRLPSLRKDDHSMAEYVLIGGLVSALTALGFAIMVRLSIGLGPL